MTYKQIHEKITKPLIDMFDKAAIIPDKYYKRKIAGFIDQYFREMRKVDKTENNKE